MVLTLLKRIVGQSGGADFLDCKAGEGKMVKTLTTYADGERVRFIKLTYSDNTTSSTHGYQSGTIHEIRFEPGERVTWVTLWTDDRYKDLARIQLSTTYNKHIDGGGYWKGYTPYSTSVGSGYLVGATSNAKSAYVKALGLIFLIEVTKTTISNVVYDPPQTNLISRTTLDSATFDKRGSASVLNWKITDSQERTNSTSFTSSTTQTFTANVSVETRIPEIAKADESYQWQTGKTPDNGNS